MACKHVTYVFDHDLVISKPLYFKLYSILLEWDFKITAFNYRYSMKQFTLSM